MQAWGIPATSAAGAQEALEILQDSTHDRFDVVLLDMQMPGMDGITLAEVIKSDPKTSHARLIILTSLGKLMDDEQLKKMGIDACLVKPVKQNRLFECLTGLQSFAAQTGDGARPVRCRAARRCRKDLRILLAEDNIINQKVAVGQLRKLGFTPDVVNNGLRSA